jgi:hypothetical protein
MKMAEISKYDDIIDVRDIIARIEALEPEVAALLGIDNDEEPAKFAEAVANDEEDRDELRELQELYSLMADICGQGGDEQWRGDWYPITMIRDSHFRNYAEELAEDCGLIQAGATWPNNCIDWDQAARQLQMDYTSVDFDGVTYWVR